ncbi:solute carrier family 12 member 3-like isoform X2 [Halichondria panicea]|uniref:solute carrier family 12 member 3-like isoform X2 n=1 Tax=Halichondria panicea TaxID=6063 RepID=UPI00312B5E3F
MSVPGADSGDVELVRVGGAPAVLNVSTHQELQRGDSPHLRFEVADVDEVPPGEMDVPPTGTGDLTLGYNTAEAVPMTLYYRQSADTADNKPRPTLDHLREGRTDTMNQSLTAEEEVDGGDEVAPPPRKKWQIWKKNTSNKPKKPKKFGWIAGVLIRCLLNIWGVMLFIRLSWVTGQAGIGLASLVILLSTVVTVITTLSMSAICTNGEVKGGGAYYLISRSLGPEFGGAIGILFSLANAVAIALYVVGFAETVADLIIENGVSFTGDRTNDIRVVGVLLIILLLIITLIGLDWEAIIQIVLLVILLVAITNFVIGTFLYRGPDSQETQRGFTGYSETFTTNFVPIFRPESGDLSCASGDGIGCFFAAFAVFFPAATGILAGANISGDLKNPQTAIPKGTLLAIGITTVVYLAVAWVAASTVIRDAPGEPAQFLGNFLNNTSCNNQTVFINTTIAMGDTCGITPYNFTANFGSCDLECACDYCVTVDCLYGDSEPANLRSLCDPGFLSLINKTSCDFGLLNNFQVTEMVSGFGPIITAGIFAATISSALTSLVSAPKVFQRVCQDRIFPFIHIFAKGGGRSGTEPVRAYFLAFFIGVGFILIGSLNEIALVISIFFLMAYTLINYSCFAASFAKSPGWRPAFKLYNQWVALVGAVICLAIMFIIRWYYALITLAIVAALYKLLDFLKPDVNWGSSTQAFLYSYSLKNLLKLEKLDIHVKNFRPQFLVLTGPPSSRPDLIHFVSHISRDSGVMVCGQVLLGDYEALRKQLHSQNLLQIAWLKREKVKAFHNIVAARTLREGVQNLVQLSGLGKIRPNTLVVGFKNNWTKCSDLEIQEYVSLLYDGFDSQFGVVIFRLRAGFDATERMDVQGQQDGESVVKRRPTLDITSVPLMETTPPPSTSYSDVPLPTAKVQSRSPFLGQRSYQPINDDDVSSLDSYSRAMEDEGRLDQDGEDPALADQESAESSHPEIVTMPSRFEKSQEKGFIDVWWLYDDGGLAILLPFLLSRSQKWRKCKLRIFTAGSSRNIDQAKLRMTGLLRKFRIDFSEVIEVPGVNNRPTPESIDKYHQLPLGEASSDLKELDKKTLRHIRLGELLRVYSSEAKLIVMTISVPQRSVSARTYLSWLETLSADLPPVLLMRGNQASVLTFYS